MRIFYQLSEVEQDAVLDHCLTIVLEDIINNRLELSPITDDEFVLKEKLEAAKEHIDTLASDDAKMDYLMNDPTISKAIFEISEEMAKTAFYHSQDEMVIFPDALMCEHNHEDQKLLPAPSKKKKDLN